LYSPSVAKLALIGILFPNINVVRGRNAF
jgi:hypothetical protein